MGVMLVVMRDVSYSVCFLEMFWPDALTSCKEFPQSHQCYLAARMSAIGVVVVAMILVTVRSFEVAMLAKTI